MSAKAIVNDLFEAGIITEAQAQSLVGGATLNAFEQGAAVADAAGGATVDAEARAAINGLLAELRTMGLIAT